jgi:hypothetical protein
VGVLINKTDKTLNPVEDGFKIKLNGWFFLALDFLS